MEQLIGNPLGVVVFWSAPGNAAPVHYDEIDVIVIQLQGTKQWYISNEPSVLPNKWKTTAEGVPRFDSYQTVDVGPGDFIYLPRGTAHTVKSTSESIHLSIGFVPLTVRDGVNAVLDHLSDELKSIRQNLGIRADRLNEQSSQATINQQIREALQELQTQCGSDQFIDYALKRRRAKMIAELPKLTSKPIFSALQPTTKVSHNPHAMIEMLSTPDAVDLCLPGEHIIVHKGAQQSLEFIVNTPTFTISQLPGDFGNDVKVALVSRLVSSGFLHVEA
jgi:ribosomal protein L16 Arg81 hydroxylase